MPRGAIVIGAEHKSNHMTIVSKGAVQVRIGKESKLVEAPATFETLAGSRKLIFAYVDSVVTNIIATELTDIEEIEEQFTTLHKDRELLEAKEKQWLS